MLRRSLYRLGQVLIRVNYLGSTDDTVHDLRLQNRELRDQISRLRIRLLIAKTKGVFND